MAPWRKAAQASAEEMSGGIKNALDAAQVLYSAYDPGPIQTTRSPGEKRGWDSDEDVLGSWLAFEGFGGPTEITLLLASRPRIRGKEAL